MIATTIFAQLLTATPPAAGTVADDATEPHPQSLEVGVGSGAFVPADGPSGLNPEVDGGLSLGLRLAYLPTTFFGVEAEAIHLASRRGLTDNGGYAVRGHVLGQLPGRLTPFILVGGGVLGRPTPDEPSVHPAGHWGVGLRWFTHANVHLRVEGRHILAFTPSRVRQDLEAHVGLGFSLFPTKKPESVSRAPLPPPQPRRVASVR